MNNWGNIHEKYKIILIFVCFLMLLMPMEVRASEEEQGNDIYDSLNEKVKNDFYESLDDVENQTKPIEISGNLLERIMRSIANEFYKNLDSIKAGSLLAGALSFLGGFIVFRIVKLNNGLRRYAISVFMITIPVVLFIFVFAISLFIDIFI